MFFLASLSSLFGSSFADPVINPSVTREINLEPLSASVDEDTHCIGKHKFGRFDKLKGADETVVIKWYHDALRLPTFNTVPPLAVVTDFLSQSILHLLSKLYSDTVVERKKLYYMQPLMVASRMNDSIHYGLMERKFELFRSHPYTRTALERFFEFREFLSFGKRFIFPPDPQGWYRRDSHLYMTDGWLQIFDGHGGYELIGTDNDYRLSLIYEILTLKVKEMKREPMDLKLWKKKRWPRVFGLAGKKCYRFVFSRFFWFKYIQYCGMFCEFQKTVFDLAAKIVADLVFVVAHFLFYW
eukprot:GEMP01052057.1.p1 GENE.GEMP01052057.1~~GEMP01052057.1.p1  ORF type:complete len:298 (+),score=31.77 GEMP01052057.1:640-1533(+)